MGSRTGPSCNRKGHRLTAPWRIHTGGEMSDVKRYDCTNGGVAFCRGCYEIKEVPLGDYVRAEDYAALLQERKATEWTACADRLPPVNENVLVTCEFVTNDWRIKTGGLDERGNWWVFGASWTPTHWQPLPAPPAD
ncbi:DUF551 domain-containing protein [Pseudomonas aeruginosa]|nr:DUF551 domain-containing protein [Pseudomonas aeruginosa]